MEPVASRPVAPATQAPAAPAKPAVPPASERGERTETTLWDVLSPSERETYQRLSSGTFTYGADGRGAQGPPPPTGTRVDLRG